MATIAELAVILTAKTQPFAKGMRAASRQLNTFSKQAGIMGAAIAASAAIAGRAFSIQQDAEIRLAVAVRNMVPSVKEALKSAKEFAAGLQRVTRFGDETILRVMAMGAAIGQLSGHQLERATKASMGLAEMLGIDLQTAMMLVSRAAAGQTSLLTRYGIVIDTTRSKSAQFQQVLEKGEEAFTFATTMAQTLAGRWAQLKNAAGDLIETIGGALAPALTAVAVLATATVRAMESLATAFNALPDPVRAVAGALIIGFAGALLMTAGIAKLAAITLAAIPSLIGFKITVFSLTLTIWHLAAAVAVATAGISVVLGLVALFSTKSTVDDLTADIQKMADETRKATEDVNELTGAIQPIGKLQARGLEAIGARIRTLGKDTQLLEAIRRDLKPNLGLR